MKGRIILGLTKIGVINIYAVAEIRIYHIWMHIKLTPIPTAGKEAPVVGLSIPQALLRPTTAPIKIWQL